MKEIVKLLEKNNKTISTMESCTGGAVVSSITNVPGAGEVLKFSAVTYSNEFKIKMGVDKNVIDKYTVYSTQTAMEMSKNIANFANSNYGVGVTGQINRKDSNNETDEDNKIYISIYDRDNDMFYNEKLEAISGLTRRENKNVIVEKVSEILNNILDNNDI